MKYKLAMSSWDTAEIEAIQKVIASDRFSMGNMVSHCSICDNLANFISTIFCTIY